MKKDIDTLKKVLYENYSSNLCYKKVSDNWNENNKSYGMCAITSLIVNDCFGGIICKIHVNNISHYFNLIDNEVVDLTAEQFFKDIDYFNYEIIDKKVLLANEDTFRRYCLLKEKINI